MAKKNDNAGTPAPQGSDQPDTDQGTIEPDSPGVAAGAEDGSATASQSAEANVDAAVGSSAADPVAASALVRALILRDCGFGDVGTVVTLERVAAETGRDQGALDLSPAAIKAFGG